MERYIGFRLRKDLDDDILEAIKHMENNSKSEIARTGMRLALGIRTQKVVEVRNMPVQQFGGNPGRVFKPGR